MIWYEVYAGERGTARVSLGREPSREHATRAAKTASRSGRYRVVIVYEINTTAPLGKQNRVIETYRDARDESEEELYQKLQAEDPQTLLRFGLIEGLDEELL